MTQLLRNITLVGMLFLPACSGGQHTPPAAASAPSTVTVNLTATGTAIHGGLFGSNLEWQDQGDGSLSNLLPGGSPWQPGLLTAMSNAGITSIRFPGGALANTYRWKSGIGPRGNRPAGLDFSGNAQPSLFGSDELLALTHLAGVPPVITVNVAAGPSEAADWVEYMNGGPDTTWGAQRIANGNSAPGKVVYWEIGNEIYSSTAPGYLNAAAYAQALHNFAVAMKARDPGIKIGAALEGSFQQAAWMQSVNPALLSWNKQVLQAAGADIDFVSIHFYTPYDTLLNANDLSELVGSGADVFGQTVTGIEQLLQSYANHNVEIGVLEYSTFYGLQTPDARTASTDAALFNALLMMRFMSDANITLANHWSLLNNNVFGMLTIDALGQLQSRPTALVLAQFKPFQGGTRLPVTVSGASYAVAALGNVPALGQVQAVQAFAGRDSGQHVRMVLVNRAVTPQAHITVSFTGTAPATLSAHIWTPSADKSQWLGPQTVTLQPVAGSVRISLPAQALAVMTGG